MDFDNFLIRSEVRHEVSSLFQKLISWDLDRRNFFNIKWFVWINHLVKTFKTYLTVGTCVHFYVRHFFSTLLDFFSLTVIYALLEYCDRVGNFDFFFQILLPFFSLLFFVSFNNFVQFTDLIVWIIIKPIRNRAFIEVFDLSKFICNLRGDSVGNLLW